jgi:CDP-diacylglycerol--glycerol-3-phosphate 3-phosphatidyltransferase
MNLPNKITVTRFFLSLVYFFVLWYADAHLGEGTKARIVMFDAALALFLVAALTDLLDGYLARSRGMVTTFGRIADPFVDKILICGSFILLLQVRETRAFVAGWMVLVIVAREFLVQGLRGALESRGVAFGSTIWGKQKMVLQCICIAVLLLFAAHLSHLRWAQSGTLALTYLTVLSTLISGIAYVLKSWRHLSGW